MHKIEPGRWLRTCLLVWLWERKHGICMDEHNTENCLYGECWFHMAWTCLESEKLNGWRVGLLEQVLPKLKQHHKIEWMIRRKLWSGTQCSLAAWNFNAWRMEEIFVDELKDLVSKKGCLEQVYITILIECVSDLPCTVFAS